jgi:hypothetical protein
MRTALLLVMLAAASIAHAGLLTVYSPFGELVERAPVKVVIAGDGSRMDCGRTMSVSRSGNRFVASAWRLPGERLDGECTGVEGSLGVLQVGTYEVEGRLYAPNEASYVSDLRSVTVSPLPDLCNRDPSLQPSVIAEHPTLTPDQIAAKVASDAAYAQRLGNPAAVTGYKAFGTWYTYFTYPPLVDPLVMLVLLYETRDFTSLGPNGRGCFTTPPGDFEASFIEFYHSGLDHYFYTGDAGEIAAIDAGKVGPWKRTGESFRAVVSPGCPFASGDTPVYRFFGTPGRGPNSHFFTRDRAECRAVDKSAQWDFEGLPMWASALKADSTCPPARVPLYRIWRPFGDSNHRFTTSRAVVAQMVAKGWIDEGAAMCVRSPA